MIVASHARRLALALAAAAVLSARGAATFAEDVPPDRLLEQKADCVVTVRMVMKVHVHFFGRTSDNESIATARAAVVDESGLVMMSNTAAGGDSTGVVKAALKGFGGDDAEIHAVPTDLRVIFASEGKEYPAVLVARDTNLDLAYVQITDLEGKKPVTVDFSPAPAVKTGQTLLVATRKSRGFDCAPILLRAYPDMRVEKPRPMWGISGELPDTGLPAYDGAGKFAGVVVLQAGSEGALEEGQAVEQGMFLVPADAIEKSLAAAKARVPAALAAAKKAAETPKEPQDPKTPKTPKTPKEPEQPPK